jgi:hypothetical protein
VRLIGWLCVVISPLSLVIVILFSRENRRVYDVLCGKGRLWACAKDATGPAITGALIALGLLVFGIRDPRHPATAVNALAKALGVAVRRLMG